MALWLVPADGSIPARQVTLGARRDVAPRWSPDGRWLAFLSDRGSVLRAGGSPRDAEDLRRAAAEATGLKDAAGRDVTRGNTQVWLLPTGAYPRLVRPLPRAPGAYASIRHEVGSDHARAGYRRGRRRHRLQQRPPARGRGRRGAAAGPPRRIDAARPWCPGGHRGSRPGGGHGYCRRLVHRLRPGGRGTGRGLASLLATEPLRRASNRTRFATRCRPPRDRSSTCSATTRRRC